jgi:phosphatidylserine synthase 2
MGKGKKSTAGGGGGKSRSILQTPQSAESPDYDSSPAHSPPPPVANHGKPVKNYVAVDYSNEMMVQDVTISWLYKPHSITALVLCVAYVAYEAIFVKTSFTDIENLKRGIFAACVVFLIFGLLVFPSGPFVRPHPALWRLVFGVSFLYLMGLILILFMDKVQARNFLTLIDPTLGVKPSEKAYAEHCEFTFANVWDAVYDRFVISHFMGWLITAMLVRDRLVCWVMSVSWEFIEISLTHHLPNFAECWWDQLILDVLLCNGLGIEVGVRLCSFLEVQQYKWSGLMSIPTLRGKATRIIAQFTTPMSWTKVRWEPAKSLRRFVVVHLLVLGFSLGQLNAFYLKYLLWVPSENDLNILRLGLIFLIFCPSIRQLYLYSANKDVERLGAQAW